MAYNGYSGFGTYPFPNFTPNFGQQYNGNNQPTPYGQPPAPLQPQAQPNGNFYYVNGEEGAKAFLVAPNQTVMLFDSDSQHFFIKQANAQGQAVLKAFEYNEFNKAPKQAPADIYITRKEFEEFKKALAGKKEVVKNV